MKKYWEKFFNLTVLGDKIDIVNNVISSFGNKIGTTDYKVYEIDGEQIAHFSMIIVDGGKKTFNAIIKKLNSQL